MKKIILNWRMAVISLLVTAALICKISEPINENTWLRDFFISKSIGAAIAYTLYRLVRYWIDKNLLPKLDFFEEE